MHESQINFAVVMRWAYSSELDTEFSQAEEDDPDFLERAVRTVCTLDQLLQFVADPRCLKRVFFATLLSSDLCWIYSLGSPGLPFHFSRLQGIMDRGAYLNAAAKLAEAIYECATIIEKMRVSGDPILQAFSDVLLDHRYRHEYHKPQREIYNECLRSLHEKVIPLFSNA